MIHVSFGETKKEAFAFLPWFITREVYTWAQRTSKNLYFCRKVNRMSDSDDDSSEVGGCSHGHSPISPREKGNKNKRKFSSVLPLDPRGGTYSLLSPLTEFPAYELLAEKLHAALHHVELMQERSTREVPKALVSLAREVPKALVIDWDDPMIQDLEVLLKNNLLATFKAAIKKLCENGVSEEVAEEVILRSAPFYGNRDFLSNIMDCALACIKRGTEGDGIKYRWFEDLQSLAEYTMIEMICMLLQVKPFLSVTEAMWCLLMYDLNLAVICTMEGNPLSKQDVQGQGEGSSALAPTGSQSKPQQDHPENVVSNPNASIPSNPKEKGPDTSSVKPNAPLLCETPTKEKEIRVSRQVAQGGGSSSKSVVEEKLGAGRKGAMGYSARDIIRQKAFQFEKSYKGRNAKGSFKGKLSACGSLVLDKNPKTPDSSLSSGACTNAQNASSTLPLEDVIASLPATSTKPPKPTTPAKPKTISSKPQAAETNTSAPPPKDVSYYLAGIPYDESLGKYVPRDEKDEVILAGVARLQGLQKELKGWDDWANQKVMQVARRLSKDKVELKMLRQEKEEREKLKKEAQVSEENNVKRLSELELMLTTASKQIEISNASVTRLEAESSALTKEIEAAKERYSSSAKRLEELLRKEQEAQKKSQPYGEEKISLQKEFAALKAQRAEMEQKVEKQKLLLNQIEAQRAYEERETNKYLAQAALIRKERERLEALAKAEEEKAHKKAEAELKKHDEDIEKLRKKISALRMESESKKIAELSWTPKVTKRLEAFRDNFAGNSLKQDHECVMCLSEDRTVVFLPCAHQVFCANCNEIHEKKGMKDCPSCRTVIQRRINARLSKSP